MLMFSYLRQKNRACHLLFFFKDARFVFKLDELGLEILRIALPAFLALAADPIASPIDTTFIGHLGPVELAAVGVAIAVFNKLQKLQYFRLLVLRLPLSPRKILLES